MIARSRQSIGSGTVVMVRNPIALDDFRPDVLGEIADLADDLAQFGPRDAQRRSPVVELVLLCEGNTPAVLRPGLAEIIGHDCASELSRLECKISEDQNPADNDTDEERQDREVFHEAHPVRRGSA